MPVRFEATAPQSPETTPTAPTRGRGRGRVLGAVGLVALLVGTVASALSARDDRPDGAAPTPDPTSTTSAVAQRPAPVELPIGAAGEGVGATTVVAGVAAGFPQTTDGAVSAVLTFTNAAGRALFTTPERLEQIAAHIYTPQARATSSILTVETARIVQEELNVAEDGTGRREDGSLDASRRAFAECLFEYGAYRVESVNSAAAPTEAVVTTWAPCLNGVGSPSDSSEVQVRWTQATTTARWSGTDWQVDGTTFPENTPPAPDEPRAVNVSFTERARLLGEGWTMPVEAREDFDLTIGLGYLR